MGIFRSEMGTPRDNPVQAMTQGRVALCEDSFEQICQQLREAQITGPAAELALRQALRPIAAGKPKIIAERPSRLEQLDKQSRGSENHRCASPALSSPPPLKEFLSSPPASPCEMILRKVRHGERSRSHEPPSEACGALVAHYGLRDGHYSLPSTRRRASRSPSPAAAAPAGWFRNLDEATTRLDEAIDLCGLAQLRSAHESGRSQSVPRVRPQKEQGESNDDWEGAMRQCRKIIDYCIQLPEHTTEWPEQKRCVSQFVMGVVNTALEQGQWISRCTSPIRTSSTSHKHLHRRCKSLDEVSLRMPAGAVAECHQALATALSEVMSV